MVPGQQVQQGPAGIHAVQENICCDVMFSAQILDAIRLFTSTYAGRAIRREKYGLFTFTIDL
jgi:hypothetical protein